jgi:hypothetical protein
MKKISSTYNMFSVDHESCLCFPPDHWQLFGQSREELIHSIKKNEIHDLKPNNY